MNVHTFKVGDRVRCDLSSASMVETNWIVDADKSRTLRGTVLETSGSLVKVNWDQDDGPCTPINAGWAPFFDLEQLIDKAEVQYLDE